MRKDDWITKLYFNQLNDKIRNNRNSGKDVSSEKKISRTQNKFEDRKWGKNT